MLIIMKIIDADNTVWSNDNRVWASCSTRHETELPECYNALWSEHSNQHDNLAI